MACKIAPTFMKRQNPNSLSKVFRAVWNLLAAVALAVVAITQPACGETITTSASTNGSAWLTRPISLAECLNIALQQNGTIHKAKSDLEASHGVVVQTRAIAKPKAQLTGQFQAIDENSIDTPSQSSFSFGTDKSWNAGIQLVQSIYEGGRIKSALRTARLTQEQALLEHQTVVVDTLLAVRVAYYDVLLAAQQIVVREASVNLLGRELDDQQR